MVPWKMDITEEVDSGALSFQPTRHYEEANHLSDRETITKPTT